MARAYRPDAQTVHQAWRLPGGAINLARGSTALHAWDLIDGFCPDLSIVTPILITPILLLPVNNGLLSKSISVYT